MTLIVGTIKEPIGWFDEIDDWLKYAPVESMALFMYQNPTRAKRLFFDVIPKNVDEYITFNQKYHLVH
jgi:lysyl-tRNA synthetase class 1